MRQRVKVLLFIGLMSVALSTFSRANSPNEPAKLNVAVAANFAQPLRELAQSYSAETGDLIQITVGSSGSLFAQIVHGAPFDVFLSADAKRPDALVKQGVVTPANIFGYARGRLAIVGAGDKGFDALRKSNHSTRIAIADPRLAPYGTAAQQLLESEGLWDRLSPALIRGNNIQQTLQFWQTGNVQLALIAASQCISYQLNCDYADAQTYQPIIQKLAVIQRAGQGDTAHEFVAWLLSEEIQQRLTALGYLPISAPEDKP